MSTPLLKTGMITVVAKTVIRSLTLHRVDESPELALEILYGFSAKVLPIYIVWLGRKKENDITRWSGVAKYGAARHGIKVSESERGCPWPWPKSWRELCRWKERNRIQTDIPEISHRNVWGTGCLWTGKDLQSVVVGEVSEGKGESEEDFQQT